MGHQHKLALREHLTTPLINLKREKERERKRGRERRESRAQAKQK